jgi:hypothetical protein
MRVFQKVSLFFINFLVGWSASAQTAALPPERNPTEIAWVAPANESSSGPAVRTSPPVSSAATSLTSASFVLHHQGDAVLLHLKDERNYVTLEVINAAGQVVQTITQANLSGGFHELTLRIPPATLSAYRLIINQEVTVFSAVR